MTISTQIKANPFIPTSLSATGFSRPAEISGGMSYLFFSFWDGFHSYLALKEGLNLKDWQEVGEASLQLVTTPFSLNYGSYSLLYKLQLLLPFIKNSKILLKWGTSASICVFFVSFIEATILLHKLFQTYSLSKIFTGISKENCALSKLQQIQKTFFPKEIEQNSQKSYQARQNRLGKILRPWLVNKLKENLDEIQSQELFKEIKQQIQKNFFLHALGLIAIGITLTGLSLCLIASFPLFIPSILFIIGMLVAFSHYFLTNALLEHPGWKINVREGFQPFIDFLNFFRTHLSRLIPHKEPTSKKIVS